MQRRGAEIAAGRDVDVLAQILATGRFAFERALGKLAGVVSGARG
jgi:hypothetical protein